MNRLAAGYMGRLLHVDLSSGRITREPLAPERAELFFGGRGLGASLLFDHFLGLRASGSHENPFQDVDPLSPENVIIISTSPATGTRMPTSGRIHMNYRSPLTGAYGSANGGGKWGVDFKKNGYDALIITGRAAGPVYLSVTPEGTAVHDAADLAELDAVDIRNTLKHTYGNRASVMTIGAGGRSLVRFAAVMVDTGKALGRGGGGAVWGSKNLLAIVTLSEPARKIPVADPGAFDPGNHQGPMYHVRMKLDMGKFTKREDMFGILASMGSLGILGMVNAFKQLIHNNMRDTQHVPEAVEQISGEALRNHYRTAREGEERIIVKKSSCYNCPIVCKRETTLLDGSDNVIEKGEGPEFESTTLLGANLSIYNLPLIVKANNLANRYGLDTISLGSTIAAFFELSEYVDGKGEGLSDEERLLLTDTEELRRQYGTPGFGREDLLLPLIHLTGTREGIGNRLAEGSFRLCRRYGHPEFSMSVKKLEMPAYDPRTSYSQALCYEMNNRGGGHLEGGYTAPHAYCAGYAEWPAQRIEGTALISKNAALKNTTLDIIGACAYGSFTLGLDEYAGLINGVTGLAFNSGSLKRLAHRVLTLERLFNIACGLSADDDWLPGRFYTEAITTGEGSVVCSREGFGQMHREFYAAMGWDAEGNPLPETLAALGLNAYRR
ncbi:hypothetical protein JXO52_03585 [bacterium]|nr:hypothetical protein [bacterium]